MTKRFAAATLENKALVTDHSNQTTKAAYTWPSGAIGAIASDGAVMNMGGHRIAGAPSDPSVFTTTDFISKGYVDSKLLGLTWKAPVRVASTANIATLSGLLTVDGVTVVASDRVLVKNQTTTTANGIYTAAAGAWTRATDLDASVEFPSAAVFIQEGTAQADTAWVCGADSTFVLGTDPVSFVQFNGNGSISLATNAVAGKVKPATNAGLDIDSFTAGDIGILLPASSGLQTTGTGLSIDLDTNPGLVLGAGGIKIQLDASAHGGNGSGLALSSTGISSKLEASNPSLEVNASNELRVKFSTTASGLQQVAAGLAIKLQASNPSLSISGSSELGVKLDAAGTITSGASGLAVNVSNGIAIVSNALRAKLGATDYSGNATLVFDSTDNGLQVKVNNTTGGLTVTASGLAAAVDGTSITKDGNDLQVGVAIESRIVENLALAAGDITAEYIAIAERPATESAVKVYLIKTGGVGPDQEHAVDFTIMEATGVYYVVWGTSGTGLTGTHPTVGMVADLVAGDKLVIEYTYKVHTPV